MRRGLKMAEKVEDVATTEKKEDNAYTDIKTLKNSGKESNLKDVAEVRMLAYVIPVAILFILAAYLLSHFVH
jgi:hypothetical protein